MSGISKSLKRFIFQNSGVNGSLIMDRQLWHPESKQPPIFAIRYVFQRPVEAALPQLRNSFLVDCQRVTGMLSGLFTEEGRVILGCITRLCLK